MKPTHFMIYSKWMENNAALSEKIVTALEKNGFVQDEANPRLVIILGGDGSFLRAVHDRMASLDDVRYLLFNTGHLGFYSDYSIGEEEAFIRDILNEEGVPDLLPLYEINIDGKEFRCINDLAIQSGETVFMDVCVDGELLTDNRCNGIVVSTPCGSSGFLSSLGSPLVLDNTSDIYQFSILAPCRNRLYVNPIAKAILSGRQKLQIHVRDAEKTMVYIDGEHKPEFIGQDFTFTHQGNESVSLLHLRKSSQIVRLRKNLSGKES